MDMLSSDGPDAMYQDDVGMGSILEQPINGNSVESTPEIQQPPNAVYYFPTVLTNVQKDMMEFCLKIFGPELVKELYLRRQRTKIHSLLDDGDDAADLTDNKLSFNEKLELIFEQIETITKHPSLLVEHFLPKKLLLLELNDRFVNMSGNYLLFNMLVNELLKIFFKNVKLPQPLVYHMLVVAETVKELELIEGLIIGKQLYYNNVSTTKLYDDNRGYPPHFNDKKDNTPNKFEKFDSDNEYKRKRVRNSSNEKFKPELCLHLITTLQLYNNCTSVLDPEIQFKLIFSFDANIDSKCPSIEMIRNQGQNVYDRNPLKIPIIIPTPVYSIHHIQTLIPRPPINSFNINTSHKWKFEILNHLYYNRFNIFEEPQDEFFINNYKSDKHNLINWLLNWDLIHFPVKDDEFLETFTYKLNMNINEEKLIKKIDHSYLLPFFGTKFDCSFEVDNFDYKSYKAKLAELVTTRLEQINNSIMNLQEEIPKLRQSETTRQLNYDSQEESIAQNYHKHKRLAEDATFVEKKLFKIDSDYLKLSKEKSDLKVKLEHLNDLKETKDIDEKLSEQEEIIAKLIKQEGNLIEEIQKLNDENDSTRSQYQESSNEALHLSVQIQKLKDKNSTIEIRSNGPGINILPGLLKKDELINHESNLKKLQSENKFLDKFLTGKLERPINERKLLMDNSSGTSRTNNRVSRGSTPY